MPLTVAKPGETVRVVKVGGLEQTHRHLEEMGFVPDTGVTVVNKIGENMILQVHDSRIALDGSLAKKIMVEKNGFEASHSLATI